MRLRPVVLLGWWQKKPTQFLQQTLLSLIRETDIKKTGVILGNAAKL
jgi:hypothetical protein